MCGVLEYNEYLFQNHCSHRHPVTTWGFTFLLAKETGSLAKADSNWSIHLPA